MAFAARYTGTFVDRGGDVYTVRILKDGWADASETIRISGLKFSYAPEDNTLFYNLLPCSLSVRIVDDIGTSSRMLGLIDAEEREYKIEVENPPAGTWSFWLKPSQISYNRDRPGDTTLLGSGGLGYLKDLVYYDDSVSPAVVYSGRESIRTILLRCLDKIGFDFNLLVTWYNVYARSTGGYQATGLDSLHHLAIDNSRFLDDDGNPFSVYDVLATNIAAACDLQVTTWGDNYIAMQRRRVINEGANTIPIFLHNKTTGDSTSTSKAFLDLDWTSNFRLLGMIESHQQAKVNSDITYDHGTPATGIIGNASFEEPINDIGGSNVDNWVKGGSSLITRRGGFISGVDGSWTLEMPPAVNSIPVVDIPLDIDATVYVEQLAGFIEGKVGRKLTIQYDAAIDFINAPGSTDVFYVLASISVVGQSKTWKGYRDTFGEYRLIEGVSAPEDRLAFKIFGVPAFQTVTIPIKELHDGTDPITGNLKIRLYRAVQDDAGQGSPEFIASLFDNVRFTITEADGDTASKATRTTCINTVSGNTAGIEGPTVRFGSGPTSGHLSRITVLNGAGAPNGDATDFQVGDNYAAPASGLSRDALFCDERLRQSGLPLGQLRGELLTGAPLGYAPFMFLRDIRYGRMDGIALANVSQFDVRFESADNPAGRPDAGFIPGREIVIGANTYTVSDCINNEDGSYLIRIEGITAGGSIADGTPITQRIFYSARSLDYDLYERTISGIWDEYRIGDGGDKVVETKIKPGSASSPAGVSGSVIVNVIGGGAGVGTVTVESVTELRTIAGTGASPVWMKSVHAGLGLGSGLWIADESDTTTPDNTGTVVAGVDSVRWKRQGTETEYRTEWFGARWNGETAGSVAATTDDSAAIQNTINAAPAGATIRLPPRITKIGTELVTDGKPLTIEGSGESYWADTGYLGEPVDPEADPLVYLNAFPAFPNWGGTVMISAEALSGSIFRIQDTITDSERRNAVRIRFIHFIGNRIPQTGATATDSYGIHVVGSWWVKIQDCTINGFTADGIHARRSEVGTLFVTDLLQVDRCHISDNGGWGVQLNQPDSWIMNCRISHNVLGGVLLGSSQNRVSNNWIDLNAGIGVRSNGTRASVITNNIIDANGSNGIFAGAGTTSLLDYIIQTNLVSNNGRNGTLPIEQRAGIRVSGGADWSITGNNCIENNTTGFDSFGRVVHRQTYGLYISGGWRGHTIFPNTYRGNIFGRTNLLTKNPDGVYNVLNHGVMQRTNDASPHIQALIDSIDEGSTVYFPEGNYQFDSTVAVTKALRFLGQATTDADGNEGSFIQANASLNAPCFLVSAGGVVFERLNFLGTDLSPSSAAVAISFTAGVLSEVDRCVVAQFKGPQIQIISPASNVAVRGSTIINGSSHGILVEGANCSIVNSEIRTNEGHGIYGLGATDLRVEAGCFIWSNSIDGVRLQDGARGIVTGNTIRSNGQAGIRIASGIGHKAESNVCYNNGTDAGVSNIHRTGIAIIGGDRISVCHNFAGGSFHGITFGDLLTSARVLDNDIRDASVSDYLWNATSQPGIDCDISGTASVDFASIAAGATGTIDVSLAGVIPGDTVMIGPPASWNTGLQVYGFVSAVDTVRLVAYNTTVGAINPSDEDWSVFVSRRGGVATAAPPPSSFAVDVDIVFQNYNLLKQA